MSGECFGTAGAGGTAQLAVLALGGIPLCFRRLSPEAELLDLVRLVADELGHVGDWVLEINGRFGQESSEGLPACFPPVEGVEWQW